MNLQDRATCWPTADGLGLGRLNGQLTCPPASFSSSPCWFRSGPIEKANDRLGPHQFIGGVVCFVSGRSISIRICAKWLLLPSW